jgi:hypothetical protein
MLVTSFSDNRNDRFLGLDGELSIEHVGLPGRKRYYLARGRAEPSGFDNHLIASFRKERCGIRTVAISLNLPSGCAGLVDDLHVGSDNRGSLLVGYGSGNAPCLGKGRNAAEKHEQAEQIKAPYIRWEHFFS